MPKFKDAFSLGSGIILIPHQVVESLENDSQVVAILADSVAEVLEKQTFRGKPAQRMLKNTNLLSDAASAVIPGLGLATGAGTYGIGRALKTSAIRQSGRVSLCLMHDAGYDIYEAPLAWWMLDKKQDEELSHTDMPDHTRFLYNDLGTIWRTPDAPVTAVSETAK